MRVRRGARLGALGLLCLLALPPVATAGRFYPSSLTAPSDPLYRHQWALRSARVPAAWPATIGSEVTVAVLDSGIDFSNPTSRRACGRMPARSRATAWTTTRTDTWTTCTARIP